MSVTEFNNSAVREKNFAALIVLVKSLVGDENGYEIS